MTDTETAVLRALVESVSLDVLLEEIAQICCHKAEALKATDPDLANAWVREAIRLDAEAYELLRLLTGPSPKKRKAE